MAMDDATILKPSNSSLILRSSTNARDEHWLEGEMIVGRDAGCAIAISSGHISRHHAKINVMRSGAYVEDLRSTNGTFINGQKIRGRVPLKAGDELRFDDVAYSVLSSQSSRKDAARFTADARQPGLASARATEPLAPKSQQKKHAATEHDPLPQSDPEASDVAAIAALDSVDELLSPEHQQPEPMHQPEPRHQPESPAQVARPAAANSSFADDRDYDDEKPAITNPDEFTQILSRKQVHQYVERNRAVYKDIDLGGGPRIIITTAPLRGKFIEFSNAPIGTQWQIGRAAESHVRLTDRTISADHARITYLLEGFQLHATRSANGILVNGEPISKAILAHNDRIQIGGAELVFKTNSNSIEAQATAERKQSAHELEEQQTDYLRHAIIGAIVVIVALVTVLLP